MKPRQAFFLTFALLTLPLALQTQAGSDANPAPGLSRGRQVVSDRLDQIRFDTVVYDGLPLSEVVHSLLDETRKRDPEKKGVNFIINPNAVADADSLETPGGPSREAIDVGSISIRIKPALTDVRLVDVLDAVVKVADRPIKYSVEDYGVVFSLQGSDPAGKEAAGFSFPGGTPNEFLAALQKQYKVDWVNVAEIPKEMVDVHIPRLRIAPGSLGAAARAGGESEPLAALVSLYNQLGEQKPELGRLLVRGDMTKPSVVMFVPDKSMTDAQPKIKVKAFSIYGINETERNRLQADIERATKEAMNYTLNMRRSSAVNNLQGTVAFHNDTSLLVATGPESFVEMVESIVAACRDREHAANAGSLKTIGTEK